MQQSPSLIDILKGMPTFTLLGVILFVIGGIGPIYIGFRAKGLRSVLPFQGGESTLKVYRGLMREGQASSWPFWLWFSFQPVGIVLFFWGIAMLGA